MGADRAAAWVTGRGAAAAVALGGDDVSGARVDIHGFPFLTQLAAGRLTRVTGVLDSGSFGGWPCPTSTSTRGESAPAPRGRSRRRGPTGS
ncbi:LmeA family phospholipid-binding protein [Xylanimonas allomyrinae]|uniref:LmeA family phospholipid-binding protein n=1 Tax=Xylanimonas allomyrinae TaxID=2509459 RepID=UPI003CCC8C23